MQVLVDTLRERPADALHQRDLVDRGGLDLAQAADVPMGITRENLRIDGGERIRSIGIDWVAPASTPPASWAKRTRRASQRAGATRP